MNKLIAIGAASYAALGLAGLAQPSRIPQTFGGTADTADSRTEIRAVYGGMPLAFAVALVATPAAAVPIGIATAGMALGRAASVALEGGETSAVSKAFIGIEVAGAAALLIGARQARTKCRSA